MPAPLMYQKPAKEATFSHTFSWPSSSPQTVIVTGTFDGWARSVKLTRDESANCFLTTMEISFPKDGAGKLFYKFIVDGNWVTDPQAPVERDANWNLNNVIPVPARKEVQQDSPKRQWDSVQPREEELKSLPVTILSNDSDLLQGVLVLDF
ncbi:immunoglobulin E-set [Jimgerdemannia flammicorona]|uniref:Immunoglobulin E-set n=1 Tax=Jimgerdemannia flammicorona TaxID=994334 RepID=A0A433QPJ2_9FUNG|nr:immunoglobulin E-set [Jimgerdemannia flammicorona]